MTIYRPTQDELFRYGGPRSAHLHHPYRDPALCGSITRGIGYRNLAGRMAAMGGGKKPYDRRVKCLITDGNSYINLLFLQESVYKIESHVSTQVVQGTQCVLFGANQTTAIGTYYMAGWYGSGFFFCQMVPGGNRMGSSSKQTNTLISIDYYNGVYSGYGGGPLALYPITISTLSLFCLFASRPSTLSTSGMAIHDFKYHSDTRDMSLIPVVKDGVGYMYDELNPTGGPNGNGLYVNSGTGTFSWEEL